MECFDINYEFKEMPGYVCEQKGDLAIYINTVKDENIMLEYYANLLSTGVQKRT
jgi:hypothetical protein